MPKQLPLSQGGYAQTANGLFYDPYLQVYYNDNAEKVDAQGKPLSGGTSAAVPYSGSVGGTPVKQVDVNAVGSFIGNLRNSVKNGTVDTMTAKSQLNQYLLTQFADPQGNFASGEAYQAFQQASQGGLVALFSNLGTIKSPQGQFGEVDLQGNFRTTSTTVNSSKTSVGGGTATGSKTYLPLDITSNLGPGASGGDVQKLQQWLKDQGFFPSDQTVTGYYGDVTKNAVAAWQKSAGIDAGADAGYFGPKSKAYLQTYSVKSTVTPEDTSIFGSEDYKALPPDQQGVVKSIYDAVSSNDTDSAAKLTAALEKAKAYADPYFKAQVSVALDTLVRGFQSQDSDAQYQERSLQTKLKDLQDATATAKEYLTLDQQSQLKQLEQTYQTELEKTQTDLAASGFGDSSRRTKTENLLSTTKGDMVESTNRAFAQKTGLLDTNVTTSTRDTADEIARLQEVTQQNKTDLGRKIEGFVGSKNLPDTPGYTPLGNVTGSAEQNYYQDIINATQKFVF